MWISWCTPWTVWSHTYILGCLFVTWWLNYCNVLLLGREELSKIGVFPIIYVLKATDRHFEDNNWNLRAICYLLWALRCSLLNFLIFFLGNQSHLMYFIRFHNLTLYHEFFFSTTITVVRCLDLSFFFFFYYGLHLIKFCLACGWDLDLRVDGSLGHNGIKRWRPIFTKQDYISLCRTTLNSKDCGGK